MTAQHGKSVREKSMLVNTSDFVICLQHS